MTEPLLVDARDVRVEFRQGRDVVRAVDGVSLTVERGEIVGVVGESGSGKTTLARAIAGLGTLSGGHVTLDGHDLAGLGRRELRRLRRRVQVVFQDPHASLSPRRTVGYLLSEPYAIHALPSAERQGPDALLRAVGLGPELAAKYPHELSGGQARRVGIARALSPELLVADEPTAGLDVSTAAGVLNLLGDLRAARGLTVLLITHDLNVVGAVADRIGVMYLGRLVELASAAALFDEPRHPYTRALLRAIPSADPTDHGAGRGLLQGEIPSPRSPPAGCRFHPRCPELRAERCSTDDPALQPTDVGLAACHWWQELAAADRAGLP